eukprot:1340053-Prymnesium_polylepis.1
MPKILPLHPTDTPIVFALQFCTHSMPQSRSAPPAMLMVMMREVACAGGGLSCGQGRPREEIGESAVLARS